MPPAIIGYRAALIALKDTCTLGPCSINDSSCNKDAFWKDDSGADQSSFWHVFMSQNEKAWDLWKTECFGLLMEAERGVCLFVPFSLSRWNGRCPQSFKGRTWWGGSRQKGNLKTPLTCTRTHAPTANRIISGFPDGTAGVGGMHF